MKFITLLFAAFSLLITVSCSYDNTLDKMEHIKRVGNENPTLALEMLDSLELDVRNDNEYIQNKYDLLMIRLSDKADVLPTSDIKIRKLVEYFEKEGTAEEKQEVYYYAGSVYRDLQDTPRALENFFSSIDYAKISNNCDSIMLRNTYSNICFLQFRVQNYEDALSISKQELELSERLGSKDIISYMHVGAAYKALDSLKQAVGAYDNAFKIIISSDNKSYYQEDIIRLLMDYSAMNEIAKARSCKLHVADSQPEYLNVLKDIALGCFYKVSEKPDSAIICFTRVVDDNTDINNMYDAAKHLHRIYASLGDAQNAYHYAGLYMQLSDSLDFGKRQELAATVNNAYKYHLDEKKEQSLRAGKERYRLVLIMVLFASVAVVSLLSLLYLRRRNIHLKKVIELSSELKRLSDDDELLREEINSKEKELQSSRKSFEKSDNELNRIKQELERVNSELTEYTDALKEKEDQLSEKIEQNKTFIKLLHQSELEGEAEEVIQAIRQSAAGKKNMTSADWRKLYQAVDDLYPTFKDELLKTLGSFTEQQMQVCYLMRIGMAKSQIQNLTNLSRVTVWRWVKKYDWVIEKT